MDEFDVLVFLVVLAIGILISGLSRCPRRH